ncbi:TorF family putative porin [Acinetobacter apis]|uniref:Outer membrane protein n=1 Tax=Acinetobacter apis TaxID=1229165 RepID=A0A217EHM5_9GAMM|nr:TorF family putative porin [Acinetobacter apis]SNQ30001.1 conserved hypothetical protein [Acinetobacter apis]
MIQKTLVLLAVAAISGISYAENNILQQSGLTVTGAATLASDYRWRGQSQGENDPAIQGTFTIAHTTGLYFNAFASSVDLPLSNGKSANLELDPTIGFTKQLDFGAFKPNLDVGLAYYNYVSAGELNYLEVFLRLGFANAMIEGDLLTPSIAYTNDYGGNAISDTVGGKVDNWNFNLLYSVPFADTGFGGVASVGYTKANQVIYGNDDHFIDWKAGVTYNVKSVAGLTAELDVVGTNIEGFTGAADRAVKTGALFSLTKTF